MPHLFVDDDPPPVLLAELGDLGGAHGGALLAARRARGERPTSGTGAGLLGCARSGRAGRGSGPPSEPMPVSERTSSSS